MGFTGLKILLAIAVLAAGWAWPAPRLAVAAEPVRVVAGPFPPYRWVKEDGEVAGIDYDIIMLVFERLNIPVTFEVLPFLRAMRAVRRGSAHAIASLTRSDEREAYLTFSAPISSVQDFFFVRRGEFQDGWRTFAAFDEARIGFSKGYNYHPSFMAHPFPHKAPVVAGNDESPEKVLMRMLAHGRIDAAICEINVCQSIIAGAPELGADITYLPGGVGPSRPFHLAFSKAHPGTPELRKKFDAVLADLRNSGEVDKIYGKYGARFEPTAWR